MFTIVKHNRMNDLQQYKISKHIYLSQYKHADLSPRIAVKRVDTPHTGDFRTSVLRRPGRLESMFSEKFVSFRSSL